MNDVELKAAHKQLHFWSSASNFISDRLGVTTRSGKSAYIDFFACMQFKIFTVAAACRSVIHRRLKKQCKTPKEAESFYIGKEIQQNATATKCQDSPVQCNITSQNTTSRSSDSTQSDVLELPAFQYLFSQLESDAQLQILSALFSAIVQQQLNYQFLMIFWCWLQREWNVYNTVEKVMFFTSWPRDLEL